MKTITYLHNTNAGDLICALPGMQQVYRQFGKKAVIHQVLDMHGQYYAGAIHSVKDDAGAQVTMNKTMFHLLRPLLLAQEYIEDFIVYNPEKKVKIEIDLTIIRDKQFVNLPNGALPSWLMLAFPPMACDISKPWIHTPGLEVIYKSRILINRTQRYTIPGISYKFLKAYESDLVFVGTEEEHALLCKEHGLDFPRLQVDDFLELAEVMQLCRFFIGNQSFCWNLANGLGVPRILEMCRYAPNCQPFIGEHNYGFYQQQPLEYYVDMLYKKTAVHWEQPTENVV